MNDKSHFLFGHDALSGKKLRPDMTCPRQLCLRIHFAACAPDNLEVQSHYCVRDHVRCKSTLPFFDGQLRLSAAKIADCAPVQRSIADGIPAIFPDHARTSAAVPCWARHLSTMRQF